MNWMAYVLAGIFLAVAGFQIAIVAGAPVGAYAYGGFTSGTVPFRLRVTSIFSALLLLAFAGHVLAHTGLVPPLAPAALSGVIDWVIVGFSGLGVIMNLLSSSVRERALWTPVLVVSLVCATFLATR